MKLPFSLEQFLKVFEDYNSSIWPLQLFFYLLALLVIRVSLNKSRKSDKTISLILSFFWIWMGIVYHLIYFSSINKAALAFGIAFILQGGLFMYFGFLRNEISIRLNSSIYGITGSLLILFALVIYPLIGYFNGHIYPASPTFGVPCPTTIFTFGILLWTNSKIPFTLLIVPIIWSVIGSSAAFSLGIKEDIGLLISSVAFVALIVLKNRKLHGIKVG